MKHHIYITPEGSINWIENIPSAFKAYDIFKSVEEYNNDFERAKAESIPFEDQEGVLRDIVMLKLNLAHVKRGDIYPIELDADIQKVNSEMDKCEYCSMNPPHKCNVIPTCTTIRARIIPKKAEESEVQHSERFKKPSSDEVVKFALLFQTEAGENPINREVLIEMVGFASMVIDRLYENGDITKPSSKEKKIEKENKA